MLDVLWKKSAMAQPLRLAGAVVPSVPTEDPTTGLLHRHRACFLSKVRISSSVLRINSQRSLQLYFFSRAIAQPWDLCFVC